MQLQDIYNCLKYQIGNWQIEGTKLANYSYTARVNLTTEEVQK